MSMYRVSIDDPKVAFSPPRIDTVRNIHKISVASNIVYSL